MEQVHVPATWHYASAGPKWDTAMEVFFAGAAAAAGDTLADTVGVRLFRGDADVSADYVYRVARVPEDDGVRVRWRVEQSSIRRPLRARFCVPGAAPYFTSEFVVASKPPRSLQRDRERRRAQKKKKTDAEA